MGALAEELRHRVAAALASLREAREAGDEYLVRVRVGELEELRRTGATHGVALPGLDRELAAHRDAEVVELPDREPGDA